MLKRYAASVSLLRSVVDIIIITAVWIVVYYVRFYLQIFSSPKGIPDLSKHLGLALPIVCICYFGCVWSGLYGPKRVQSMFRQFRIFINLKGLCKLIDSVACGI